jgi:hypothetical protein
MSAIVHACGLSKEGIAYCWINDYRQLGWLTPVHNRSCGGCHRTAIRVNPRECPDFVRPHFDGESYCWGVYQHTDPHATYAGAPRRIPADGRFSSVVRIRSCVRIGIDGFDRVLEQEHDGAAWNGHEDRRRGAGPRSSVVSG